MVRKLFWGNKGALVMNLSSGNEDEYDKFYKWLETCPVKWSESNHPTSGMTSVTFTIEEED